METEYESFLLFSRASSVGTSEPVDVDGGSQGCELLTLWRE